MEWLFITTLKGDEAKVTRVDKGDNITITGTEEKPIVGLDKDVTGLESLIVDNITINDRSIVANDGGALRIGLLILNPVGFFQDSNELTRFFGFAGANYISAATNHQFVSPSAFDVNSGQLTFQQVADAGAGLYLRLNTNAAEANRREIGFFGETTSPQATTAIPGATFVPNATGVGVTDDSTFDGYTIGKVVKALRELWSLSLILSGYLII